jgi:oligopeptide/dipeptide ABC transporter ATP-binding protein
MILEAQELIVEFQVDGRTLRAVDRVSLSIAQGETLAVVGESGSGKSTLAFALMGVYRPKSGRIGFDGADITDLPDRARKAVRRAMQMVFQDPYGSLDPTWTIERIVAEPLAAYGLGDKTSRRARVAELLGAVGLSPDYAARRPSALSGGQRQRVAIARALALKPRLLVADEPVSALDVSVQAQIVQLLDTIRRKDDIACLVIAHDLALVQQIADRIAVMYLGRIVEQGPANIVLKKPMHPYTAALIAATPALKRPAGIADIVLKGEPPSALDPPGGCAFHPRCPIARPRCAIETPGLAESTAGRADACFYSGEICA